MSRSSSVIVYLSRIFLEMVSASSLSDAVNATADFHEGLFDVSDGSVGTLTCWDAAA